MTVRKKIENKDNSVDAIRYVSKGGEVSADKTDVKSLTTIAVRMPKEFLDLIDENVKKRIGLSRNAWIIEALQEKLQK